MYGSIQKMVMTAIVVATSCGSFAQSSKRPARAVPPTFENSESEGIFFPDLAVALKGEFPWRALPDQKVLGKASGDIELSSRGQPELKAVLPGTEGGSRKENPDASNSTSGLATDRFPRWSTLISPESLEDLIKESKQRLDQVITTPSSFAGGGYQKARVEFSLLSLLFAIVEVYPEDMRWKISSSTMKILMNRVGSNARVGSLPVFDEAKRRQADLEAVLNAQKIELEPNTELALGDLIDIGLLMQIIGMAYEQHIVPLVANDLQFSKGIDELARNSELIAVLSTVATLKDMPNADDEQYCALAAELTDFARMITKAVDRNDASAARIASGRMGQSCQKCHDSFR